MSRIHVLICRSDDPAGEHLTELACFDLPEVEVTRLQPATALDDLEASTCEIGNAVLRRVLQARWDTIDAALTAQYRQQFPPSEVSHDGTTSVTVASRVGRLTLERQIVAHRTTQTHVLPGNAVLPPHQEIIITRGLQEWACLLPQELSFEPVRRLLGWQTQEEQVVGTTTLRCLVRAHGLLLRQTEQAEAAALLQQDDLPRLTPQLVPATAPRRRPGWPPELSAAVDLAVAAGAERPPRGIIQADWERMLAARRREATCGLEDLRHLGPELEPGQVLLTTDDVLTRTPQKQHFWEVRTACLTTAAGTRYLSGTGEAFLQVLRVLTLLGVGRQRSLLLLADGARWIRTFFAHSLSGVAPKTMILDWWHLRQKCAELASRICRGRLAKDRFLRQVQRRLWRGHVDAACAYIAAYRPEARNVEKLAEVQAYLRSRRALLPDYRQRYCRRQYIGSGHGEKTNDLLVARRQKGHGRHWSLETSDTLAALRTLMLNGGWERYWRRREVLLLLAAS